MFCLSCVSFIFRDTINSTGAVSVLYTAADIFYVISTGISYGNLTLSCSEWALQARYILLNFLLLQLKAEFDCLTSSQCLERDMFAWDFNHLMVAIHPLTYSAINLDSVELVFLFFSKYLQI
jgi:hypothetical protein